MLKYLSWLVVIPKRFVATKPAQSIIQFLRRNHLSIRGSNSDCAKSDIVKPLGFLSRYRATKFLDTRCCGVHSTKLWSNICMFTLCACNSALYSLVPYLRYVRFYTGGVRYLFKNNLVLRQRRSEARLLYLPPSCLISRCSMYPDVARR